MRNVWRRTRRWEKRGREKHGINCRPSSRTKVKEATQPSEKEEKEDMNGGRNNHDSERRRLRQMKGAEEDKDGNKTMCE